ncbi:dihydroxyacetone kinase subunit DhaL [Defluviitalea saccharophila]|jgi:dihydroxyacetone kinase-like protein|uniref:Dihydroxyacetone kinase subunit DhaL n=1 Tax=Defluviitalea saccharophila TaxID=879970 RepID=A0ABZ2Y0M4_9FIRM|nr:dihydroxyacetone kinase subunit L [Candidatus Epulonipiscium sp.]
MINNEKVVLIIQKIAEKIHENRQFLTDLDAAIGDGDHGINLDRGFQAVVEKLPTVKDKDIGTILKTVGMTLVSTVGGASGPLYGTAFMKAGAAMNGKMELETSDLLTIIDEAAKGIKMRGKAERGEKTMLDAIEPAYEVLRRELEKGSTLKDALDEAENAAKEGVEYTKTIIATKGRASYLGERSIGHQDPGATSSMMIFTVLKESCED